MAFTQIGHSPGDGDGADGGGEDVFCDISAIECGSFGNGELNCVSSRDTVANMVHGAFMVHFLLSASLALL